MTIWPRSLAVQLIVTLLLAQGLGILLALIAFPLLGPFTTYRSIANHSARQLVTESLRREGTGRWRIDPTPRLQAYARSRPHLRWAARTGAGDTVEGSAPELVQVLRQIGDLRTVDEDNLRIAQPGREGVVYVAANRSHAPGIMIAIAGDEFHGDDVSAFFRFFLPAVLPIYGPVLLGMMLVLPFALRRVLGKVRRAAAAAALIDVHSLDTRLPAAKLPSEFEPLVVSINAALERLRKGWERQRAFTANAAHEIRTPITVLLGRIDLLPADAPLRDALMRDVRRLALLSDHLLAIARLEGSDAAVKSLDLVGLVRGVVADWAPIAIAAGRGVVFEAEVERLEIRGSVRAIEGAVGALLDNALKVEPRDREVEVSVTADARVMVRDHGPGIDPAHRVSIFEPFWREKETTKGFGLGLASVRRTAQLHGGHVNVETAGGGGAVFVLAFPAHGRTPSIAAPTPDQAPRSNLGLRPSGRYGSASGPAKVFRSMTSEAFGTPRPAAGVRLSETRSPSRNACPRSPADCKGNTATMRLRRSPKIGPRYWTAIAIASMCGTNAGDCLPDVFGIGAAPGLAILTALFAVVLDLERVTRRGSEAFYWIAILVVRAAATNVADCAIGYWRSGYAAASALLSILVVILIRWSSPGGPARGDSGLPSTGGAYWATMLAAGSLGTIIGDGIGHAFGAVEIGVPVSAALATVALAVSLSIRVRLPWRTVASYWLTVVVVRWWGTNFGDILAHFLSLGGSLLATASALILVLSFWPTRPPVAARRNDGTYIF